MSIYLTGKQIREMASFAGYTLQVNSEEQQDLDEGVFVLEQNVEVDGQLEKFYFYMEEYPEEGGITLKGQAYP